MGIPTDSPLTPGPWKSHRGHVTAEVSTGTWDDEPNRESYGGYLICESVFPGNARLIAAAPDLLEQLERLVLDIGDDNVTQFAREAIDKAKGKTT